MQAVSVLNPAGTAPLLLTCEHASCAVPVEYDDLGLAPEELRDHIGWDIGARQVTEGVARHFDATAILSGVSRLVIDCNRDLADHDLIVGESHGVPIPGNAGLDSTERHYRIREFYDPYHAVIDAALKSRPPRLLLSVHSFTPALNGRRRRFDIGVLFDSFAADAERLGDALEGDGLRVRYNEPYSGLDGLIFSARTHGTAHDIRYLEIEINNALIDRADAAAAMAARVAAALRSIL